jgi:hypothetical protein
MTAVLIVIAVAGLVGVMAAELKERCFGRRRADAGRSRMPVAPEKVRLRW